MLDAGRPRFYRSAHQQLLESAAEEDGHMRRVALGVVAVGLVASVPFPARQMQRHTAGTPDTLNPVDDPRNK
jgi:hypothetical protein